LLAQSPEILVDKYNTSIILPSEDAVKDLHTKDGKKNFEPNMALSSSLGKEFDLINN